MRDLLSVGILTLVVPSNPLCPFCVVIEPVMMEELDCHCIAGTGVRGEDISRGDI